MTTHELNLDTEGELRAAKREGANLPLPIRWKGEVIAELPVELPFDVIAPLAAIDSDLTLLLRQAVQVARNNQSSERWDAAELVIDVLAANPALPSTVITVVKEMATALLGEDGLRMFLDGKPSVTGDMAALAKGILRHYGVGLGEASPSSGSSETGGGTSSTTSSLSSTDSTPVDSSPAPALPAS